MPHKTGTTEVYRSIPIDMNFRYGGLLYESASSLDGSDRSFCYLYYTNIALSNKVEAENLPLPITGTTRKVGLM